MPLDFDNLWNTEDNVHPALAEAMIEDAEHTFYQKRIQTCK